MRSGPDGRQDAGLTRTLHKHTVQLQSRFADITTVASQSHLTHTFLVDPMQPTPGPRLARLTSHHTAQRCSTAFLEVCNSVGSTGFRNYSRLEDPFCNYSPFWDFGYHLHPAKHAYCRRGGAPSSRAPLPLCPCQQPGTRCRGCKQQAEEKEVRSRNQP